MENKKPILEDYVGKEVSLQYSVGNVIGTLAKIDLENYCMEFLPYLAIEGNEKNVRIEKEIPRRIALNVIEPHNVFDIQALKDGDLEKRVENINEAVKNRGKFGFHNGGE